jgi:outer membrane protein assembly factor BamE (lipoprotein component of BamABCDE complex)
MRKEYLCLFFILGLFLVSPAPVDAAEQGAPLLTDKLVRQVKPGMTRQEVRALVGEPARIRENKDGTQIWFYERKAKRSSPPAPELPNPMPNIGRLEIGVKVKFNAEGIAVHVKQRISETDRKSRLVSQEQFAQEMMGS